MKPVTISKIKTAALTLAGIAGAATAQADGSVNGYFRLSSPWGNAATVVSTYPDVDKCVEGANHYHKYVDNLSPFGPGACIDTNDPKRSKFLQIGPGGITGQLVPGN